MARSALLLVVAAGLLATCGGGTGSDSSGGTDPGGTSGSDSSHDQTATVTCSSLDPSDCGGDLAGSWELDSLCDTTISAADYLPADCAGTLVHLEPTGWTGSSTFKDGSFTTTATVDFAASTTLDAACIQAIAAGRDAGLVCTSLGPALMAWEVEATCALDGDECKCEGTYSNAVNQAGAYSVSGNQLTLTPASSAEDPDPEPATTTFCVRSGYLISEMELPVPGGEPIHCVLRRI